MASLDREIHELPAATEITDAGLFVTEQDGEARKVTGALLRAFVDRNVVTVTVATAQTNTITAQYDESTGDLLFTFPAQMINAYSKAETDALINNILVPQHQVVVSTGIRLDGVLLQTSGGSYPKALLLPKSEYELLVQGDNIQQDVLYLPYDAV